MVKDRKAALIGIFFSKDDSIIGKTIRLVTRSKVNHTGIIYYDGVLDHYMVMHADNLGFNIIPLKRFIHKNTIIAFYAPKTNNDTKNMRYALTYVSSCLGAEYDYPAVLGFLFVITIRRWFHIKMLNPLRDSSKMFCSEAVANLLKKMDIGFNKDPETTSPEDLLKILPNEHFILSNLPKS
jgi:hypothetical protein